MHEKKTKLAAFAYLTKQQQKLQQQQKLNTWKIATTTTETRQEGKLQYK